jgi:receptor protein-tyrosine kinase
VALAGIGVRVILVDLDLRRPRLHDVFHIDNQVGFTSVLLGQASLDRSLVSMLTGNDLLSVLPSGPIPPNPSELLSSPRVAKLFAELRERADLVLLDTPPVLPVTDSLIVSRSADAVVLVTAVGTTSRRELARANELLRQVGAPLAGTVLNRADDMELYGYGYGYTYGNAPEGLSLAGGDAEGAPPRRRGHRLLRRRRLVN